MDRPDFLKLGTWRAVRDHFLVHFGGEVGDFLAEFPSEFSKAGVLLDEGEELGGLLVGEGEALGVLGGEGFAMAGVGFGAGFITVRLAGLGEEDERSGVGGLKTEGEVEEDEGVDVEVAIACRIHANPDGDDDGLADEKDGGAEEAGEGFGLEGEPIVAEGGAEVKMGQMEADVVVRMIGMVAVIGIDGWCRFGRCHGGGF